MQKPALKRPIRIALALAVAAPLAVGAAFAQETTPEPTEPTTVPAPNPGTTISEAAKAGGSKAVADVARENAPGTAVSAEKRGTTDAVEETAEPAETDAVTEVADGKTLPEQASPRAAEVGKPDGQGRPEFATKPTVPAGPATMPSHPATPATPAASASRPTPPSMPGRPGG